MSILTFGGGQNAVDPAVQQNGISEELRDEKLNQQLMDAYRKKQAGQYLEALKVYTSVLEDEFLIDAKIDKHVFMRFNAHKNSGEAYEKTLNFPLAKYHYTQALKIQQKDSFIWTRLGYLEFEHFKDFELALACFDAAAKTLNTLEKRGAKMCPILVKLAEINFLLYDFKTSEVMVDTLINRGLPDQSSQIFAFLMKSYFATLKNEPLLADQCVKRAQKLRPSAKIEDLAVIKVMQEQQKSSKRQPFMICPTTGECTSLRDNVTEPENLVKLESPTAEDESSFPTFFTSFVSNFRKAIDEAAEKENKISLVLDCKDYQDFLGQHKAEMAQDWARSFAQWYDSNSQNDEKPATDVTMEQTTAKDTKQVTGNETKRGGLRRKLDNDDILMRKIKLDAFEEFKERVLFRDDFQEITSQAQIKAIQDLFQRRANMSHQQTQAQQDEPMEESKSKADAPLTPVSLLDTFEKVLATIQGKNVYYVARNLLRFIVDGDGRPMLTTAIAYDIFRIYTLVIQASGPCAKSVTGLDQLDQFWSFNVILVMFELALFNNDVIKKAKSGPVMSHRQQIFSYLNQFIDTKSDASTARRETYADYRLREQLSQQFKGDDSAQNEAFAEFKVRLLYAMMFYSFEIQNDMPLSVTIYQMLDLDKLQTMRPIEQGWISRGTVLDQQKITTFGNCKIQEAQKVRDYDHALNNMKQADVLQMKKGGKQPQANPEAQKTYQPECTDYARFYLEQLFNYLVLALANESQSGEPSSLSVAFSSNEEKIKEMWEKLCYSLSKAHTHDMLAIAQYVFCTMTAFQILNKSYYDSFILKRIDFEKLISVVADRLRILLEKAWETHQLSGRGQSASKIKAELEGSLQRGDIETFLLKIQVHLLRLFTPEWIHSNVRQHGELDNQLLQVYYKSLLSIEMLKSCLQGGEYEHFEGAIVLLRSVDSVTEDNSEMMQRPYLRLVQFAFPYMVQLFSSETREAKNNLPQLKSLLQSDFAAFVEHSLAFLLHFEVDFDEMLPSVHAASRRSEDHQMTDEKRPMFTQLIKQTKQPSSGALNFFKELVQVNAAKLNIHLMADVIHCLDFCLEGRLLGQAQLTYNDLTQVVKVTEAMGSLVFQYRNWLTERCPLSKERCVAIKNTYRDVSHMTNNTSKLMLGDSNDTCLCVQQGKASESCYEKDFPIALSTVIFFLLNVFAQVGLPSASSILPSIQLPQRQLLLERLSSLNELKKLRALSYIDLQYSQNLEVSSLFMSYTFLQYYQTSNEAKIQTNYETTNEYRDMRQFHKQAANCVVAALKFLLIKEGASASSSGRKRQLWANLTDAMFMKLAMEQLLQIQLVRVRSKEHVKFFSQALEMPSLQAYLTPFVYLPTTERDMKSIKLRFLRDETSLYASICAKLDRLSSPVLGASNDPRQRSIPRAKILEVSKQIVQTFLKQVAETQVQLAEQQQQQKDKSVGQTKQKQILLNDKGVQTCKSTINYLCSDNDIQMTFKMVPLSSLNFDYTYLEAILLQEDELHVNPIGVELLLKSLDIAIDANNLGGVFQSLVKIIEVALLMATQLKYNPEGQGMQQATRSNYQQMLETIKQQVIYNSKLKSALDQFLALTMVENQEKITKLIGESQNTVAAATLDLRVDQDLLIYNKNAITPVRHSLMKKHSFSEINQTEKLMANLYEMGDKLVSMLTKACQRSQQQTQAQGSGGLGTETKSRGQKYQDLQKEWLKVECSQMLARNFYFELQAHIQKAQLEPKSSGRQRQNANNTNANNWEEAWKLVHEMQAAVAKDLQDINGILSINIQTFQQMWGQDTILCPLGVLKPNTLQKSNSKNLLNLQVVQTSLTQFFSVDSEIKVQQDGSVSRVCRTQKSLASFYICNVFAAGILRARVNQLQLLICEHSGDYKPARDIFKSSMTKMRQHMEHQTPNQCKYREMQIVFDLSKQVYLSLITKYAENLCYRYNMLYQELRHCTSEQQMHFYRNAYYELRQKYHTSHDVIPPILKDIFEIFVETHNSKQFLRKLELISSEQQLQLRQSVLKVCAVCGPDSEMGASGLVTAKFINLAKLNDPDYLYEGLRICISWFEKVLEGSATSHQLNTNQASTNKQTARGTKNVNDLRRRLLETYEEIERKISGAASGSTAVPTDAKAQQQQSQKQGKEAQMAQQVFKAAASKQQPTQLSQAQQNIVAGLGAQAQTKRQQ